MWCFSCLYFLWYRQCLLTLKRQMDISLPSSRSSVPSESQEPVKVELTMDNQIFLNGEKVTLEEFESELSKISVSKNNAAVIRADKNLPYGNVIKIMGILQSAKNSRYWGGGQIIVCPRSISAAGFLVCFDRQSTYLAFVVHRNL